VLKFGKGPRSKGFDLMKEEIKNKIIQILKNEYDIDTSLPLFIPKITIPSINHGDYSTNIALILAKKLNQNPKDIAENIKSHLEGLECIVVVDL
jgi:arginyl-tRNA synthetase